MPNTPLRTRKRRNNLRRLNLCFPNPMQPFTPESPPPTITPSSANHNRQSSPATSSNIFNNDDHTVNIQNPFLNLEPEPEPADLATAFASQRFFFSSPGRSNSIFDSTNTDADCTTSSSSPSTTVAPPPPEPPTVHHNRLKSISDSGTEDSTVEEKEKAVFSGGVAVERYSADPYGEFRRSMEEMVEARPELMEVNSNWNLLHELLLCYLALNPKTMHRFIFAAFADLLVSLISLSSSPPPRNAGAGDVARGGDECSV